MRSSLVPHAMTVPNVQADVIWARRCRRIAALISYSAVTHQ